MSGDTDNFSNPEIPRNVRNLVKAVGFADFVNMASDEQEIYDRARNGRCMTCEGQLGKNSNVIVNRFGIVAAYCSGQCHSDMAIMGFLQETHDDLTSQIAFRGEQHPQADTTPEVPDTLGDDPAFGKDDNEG